MNLIGDLVVGDSVVDFSTSPELDGAHAVVTAVVDGQVFVYVTGFHDDGIQVGL